MSCPWEDTIDLLFIVPSIMRLKLRKPYFIGQTEIVMPSLDFLSRLTATIPPRRMNMVRFHGVFAPKAKVRKTLKLLLPNPPAPQKEEIDQGASPKAAGRGYRRPWHELLKRVFDLDILVCGKCGSKMHRISHIEDPKVVEQILGHLNLTRPFGSLTRSNISSQLEISHNALPIIPPHCVGAGSPTG